MTWIYHDVAFKTEDKVTTSSETYCDKRRQNWNGEHTKKHNQTYNLQRLLLLQWLNSLNLLHIFEHCGCSLTQQRLALKNSLVSWAWWKPGRLLACSRKTDSTFGKHMGEESWCCSWLHRSAPQRTVWSQRVPKFKTEMMWDYFNPSA